MDNNNKEVTPREFKVGDIVWDCINYGKGVVVSINEDDEYPVCVDFESSESDGYTLKGYRVNSDLLPSLYHQPYKIELIEAPEELPEVGTPVYVWDDGDTSCQIQFFLAKSEHLCQTTATLPIRANKTHWDNMSLALPEQFK